MKWRVRKPGARNRAKRLWHKWFAWYPVRVPTYGKRSGMTMVWLQHVKRKQIVEKCYHVFFDEITEYIYKELGGK